MCYIENLLDSAEGIFIKMGFLEVIIRFIYVLFILIQFLIEHGAIAVVEIEEVEIKALHDKAQEAVGTVAETEQEMHTLYINILKPSRKGTETAFAYDYDALPSIDYDGPPNDTY